MLSTIVRCRLSTFSCLRTTSKYRPVRPASPTDNELSVDLTALSPDEFGTLSSRRPKLAAEDLPDDDDGYDVLEKMKRGKPVQWYDERLKKLLYGHRPDKVKRAIKLFEQMQREDRIHPDKYHYSLLLMGCSHLGLAEQAIELFRQQNAIHGYERPTKSQITSLFNACAECTDSQLALDKAHYLRDWIYEYGFQCNSIHYNAMIKAFGRHGDLKTAMKIVKEMVQNECTITAETYNMLLMGCVADKQSGLSHAIRIVRQMRRRNVPLSVYSFNLLLRCVRDCGVGSKKQMQFLLDEWRRESSGDGNDAMGGRLQRDFDDDRQRELSQGHKELSTAPSPTEEPLSSNSHWAHETSIGNVEKQIDVAQLPNLLEPLMAEQSSTLVDFDFESLNDPTSRLYLLGGLDGVCQLMREEKAKPNSSTASLLLDSLPNDVTIEEALIANMKKMGCKFDTDFYNMLIKKRCFRRDYALAKQAIFDMQAEYLYPDIVTFSSLASMCHEKSQAMKFISDLKHAGFKLNASIMGVLIRQACIRADFDYLQDLLVIMKQREIHPTPKMVEHIAFSISKVEKILYRIERGLGYDGPERPYKTEGFEQQFNAFKRFYDEWLDQTRIDMPEKFTKQFEFKQSERPKAKYDEFEREMKEKIKKRIEKELKAELL